MSLIIYFCVPVAFVLGYVVGRLDLIAGRLADATGQAYQPAAFSQRRAGKNNSLAPNVPAVAVDINEATVVLPVNTAGMQKTSQIELGKTTAVADDINSAASRLAQLKGN
jgi:hypothetical protein